MVGFQVQGGLLRRCPRSVGVHIAQGRFKGPSRVDSTVLPRPGLGGHHKGFYAGPRRQPVTPLTCWVCFKGWWKEVTGSEPDPEQAA